MRKQSSCKHFNPDIVVTLEDNIDEVSYGRPDLRTGFLIPGNNTVSNLVCKGSYEGRNETLNFIVLPYSLAALAPPEMRVEGARQRNGLDRTSHHLYDVLSGSNVTVMCGPGPSGHVAPIVVRLPPTVFAWSTPEERWRHLHIPNLTESGEVDCYMTNRHVNSSAVTATLTVIEPSQRYLTLGPVLDANEGLNRLSWRLYYRAHATPRITWTKVGDPDEVLMEAAATDGEHCSVTRSYCITILPTEGKVDKVMLSSTRHAVGAYTVTASLEDLNRTLAFNYSKLFMPQDTKISLPSATTKVRLNAPLRVECSASGFPSPDLTVLTTPCHECDVNTAFSLINSTVLDDCNSTKMHCQFSVEKKTVFYVSFLNSTSISCSATNVLGNLSSEERKIEVYDTPTDVFESLVVEFREDSSNYIGFGRQAASNASGGSILHSFHNASVVEGSNITLECRAQLDGSRSQMLVWQQNIDPGCLETHSDRCTNLTTSSHTTTRMTVVSTVSALTMRQVKKACLCLACTNAATRETVTLLLTVKKSIPPHFLNASWQQPGTLDVEDGHTMILRCPVDGLPLPTVTWLKGDKSLSESSDDRVNVTAGSLSIIHSKHADSGFYTCVAGSRAGAVRWTVQVTVLSGLAKASTMLLSVVAVVSVMLAIVSTVVFYRIVQDRKKQSQLRREEQELFEATNGDQLDPGLSPQDQVDLLPYKPCYNIDRNCLIFGRQLGVGAFGRVYQAELITRVPGELPTTVAVKTIKSKTNNEHVRAFRSEIKILMYVGRHRNIINLIGVCCQDMVDKGEMLMVVEYCQHKSLLDYMRTNRRLFEEQTSGGSDGVSISPGSPIVYWPAGTVYQNTGTISTLAFPPSSSGPSCPLLLGVTETLASVTGRSVSELTKARLLDWVLQVANAMSFLAAKKIIHGDLATRNILLTEDNVIKVADFGLAKDVYNKINNIYKLDTNRVLAVKWAAMETLKFSELTTASDVWAFGVVMWEIFSLGANPYSEVENLLLFLESGSRLQKPRHSSDLLYGVMLQCWQEDPSGRPTFEVLEHTLCNFDLIPENQGEINPSFQPSGWSYGSGSFCLPYASQDHSTTTTYLPMTPVTELPPVLFKDNATSQNFPDMQSISSPKPVGGVDAKRDSNNEQAEELVVKNGDAIGEDKLIPSIADQAQVDDRESNNNLKDSDGSSEQIRLATLPRNTEYVLHPQSGHLRGKSKSDVKEGDLSFANDLRDFASENYISATSAAQIQTNPEYVLMSTTRAIK